MRLVAEMVGELDLHRALDQPLRQPRKQATRPNDLLLRSSPREQLIDELVRQLLTQPRAQAVDDALRGRRRLA